MIKESLENIIKPILDDLGYELWGIEYLAQGKYSTLRVYIDKPEGIVIEDCEQASRQISAILDVEDPIKGNYSLEVSSPGIPRPLFYAWQYQRYPGCEINLKLIRPVNGQRKWTGNLVSASEHELVVSVEGENYTIQISNIAKANLTV